MNGIYPKCFFRIFEISQKEMSGFDELYKGDLFYKKGKSHKDHKSLILLIPLHDQVVSEDSIVDILKTFPGKKKCDFYVSIFTDAETFVVDVPDCVMRLYDLLGGRICIGYTYSGNSENE